MVFCFKQKAAYEVRISDWSSDVCSSDLCVGPRTDGGDDRVNSLLHFYDSFASIGRTATTQEQLMSGWRERWDDDIDMGGTRTQLAVGASRLRAAADIRLRGQSDGGRACVFARQIGSASRRETVGQYAWISGVRGVL